MSEYHLDPANRLERIDLHHLGSERLRQAMQPRHIQLQPIELDGGLAPLGAPGLLARRMEQDGTVWATRGFALYRRPPGEKSFHFETRLPCPWNATALLHSASLRSYLRRHDVAQPFWLASGSLLVSAGGWLWRRSSHERRFRRVFQLRFWGRGIGRGILDNGLVQLRSGRILFGEYFRNPGRVPVHVYASDDDAQSWRVIHEFPAGRIRHIHAVIEDPYGGGVWLCTGDLDHESFLAHSSNGGDRFDIVGGGSQTWRACCVLFTPEYVYWGADTSKDVEHRNIYRLRRGEAEPEPLQAVDGAVEFAARLGDDLFAFSTSRNGHEDPADRSPRLWVGREAGSWHSFVLGRWSEALPGAPGKAYLCAAGQGQHLALSLMNLQPHDGMLLLTSHDAIARACPASVSSPWPMGPLAAPTQSVTT
jgi:hypothetical protein